MSELVAADAWYRCSRSGPGLCYWDGPQSELAGVNHNRCPACLSPAVEVSQLSQSQPQSSSGTENK